LENCIKNNAPYFKSFKTDNHAYDPDSDRVESVIISLRDFATVHFDNPDDIFAEIWTEFNEYLDPFRSKINISDHYIKSQFALQLVKKFPEIQKRILVLECNSPGSRIIIADPFKIMLETIRPYLNRIKGKLNIISNPIKLSWDRGGYARSSILGISRFCSLTLNLRIDDNIIKAPISNSKSLKSGLTLHDISSTIIKEQNDGIVTFLNAVTSDSVRSYIVELLNYKHTQMQDMGKSGFDKMLTVMNATPIGDIKKYLDLKMVPSTYIDPKDSSEIKLMLSKIGKLELSKLGSFAVTTNGIQFKITNISTTKSGRTVYGTAYRFQVNVPFLNWNVRDVVDLSCDEYDIEEAMYNFYTSLSLIGNKKQFDDKLQMAALGNM